MRPVRRWGFFLRRAAGAGLLAAPLLAQYGDARRGAESIERRSCTLCHSIRGAGGGTAPDLSRRSTRDFTPATLAASMWNHGPAMWRAMSARNLPVLSLGPTEIADLYAYFYSIRYFDLPGDAGRGKALFSVKKCSICHALTPEEGKRPGPPVSRWPAIANRIRWSEHMWNHSGAMMAEIEKRGIRWPTFTLQEMVDLLVYVRNLPQRPDERPSLVFDDPLAGEKVFRERGCGRCHTLGAPETGKIDLVGVARAARTFTELGVRMWNHLPQMRQRAAAVQFDFPTFSENEMSQLMAYLFAQRYFEEKGKPARGRGVFAAKKCGSCHDQPGSGALSLHENRGQFSAHRMAAALWQHGPRMRGEMEKRRIPWPVFSGAEMADLIAFLNAR
ncbi:MAG: c-type cytochrome [Candidatus Solibacter usitatus]|nr:c-type cytochrome [Candidatus Solibacter usitatus]